MIGKYGAIAHRDNNQVWSTHAQSRCMPRRLHLDGEIVILRTNRRSYDGLCLKNIQQYAATHMFSQIRTLSSLLRGEGAQQHAIEICGRSERLPRACLCALRHAHAPGLACMGQRDHGQDAGSTNARARARKRACTRMRTRTSARE